MNFNGKNLSVVFGDDQEETSLLISNLGIKINVPQEEFINSEQRSSLSVYPTQESYSIVDIDYLLTGVDFFKRQIYNDTASIYLRIGDFYLNSGLMTSYNLSVKPNSPIQCKATIQFIDLPESNITPSLPSLKEVFPILSSNSTISGSGLSFGTLSGIKELNYNYSCSTRNVLQINEETGLSYITLTSIYPDKKAGELNLTVKNVDLNRNYFNDFFDVYLNWGVDYLNIEGFNIEKNSNFTNVSNGESSLSIKQTNLYPTTSFESKEIHIKGYHEYPESEEKFRLNGSNISFISNAILGGKELLIKNKTDSYIDLIVPNDITSGLFKVNTFDGDIIPNNVSFYFDFVAPRITSLSSFTGSVGDYVTIFTNNASTVNKVYFGRIEVEEFSNYVSPVSNDGFIRTKVPENFGTGLVSIGTESRMLTGVFGTNFKTPPIINSFTPQTGLPGDIIKITGRNFNEITKVRLNTNLLSFTITSDSGILATLPGEDSYIGGYFDIINENNNLYNLSARSPYPLSPEILITGVNPTSGYANDVVRISGYNFNPLNFYYDSSLEQYLLAFNGGITGFTIDSTRRLITTRVPANAETGPITFFNQGLDRVYQNTGYFIKNTEKPSFIYGNKVSPSVVISGGYSGYIPTGYHPITIEGKNLKNISRIILSGINNTKYFYFDKVNYITGLLTGKSISSYSGSNIREDLNGNKLQFFVPNFIYSKNQGLSVFSTFAPNMYQVAFSTYYDTPQGGILIKTGSYFPGGVGIDNAYYIKPGNRVYLDVENSRQGGYKTNSSEWEASKLAIYSDDSIQRYVHLQSFKRKATNEYYMFIPDGFHIWKGIGFPDGTSTALSATVPKFFDAPDLGEEWSPDFGGKYLIGAVNHAGTGWLDFPGGYLTSMKRLPPPFN